MPSPFRSAATAASMLLTVLTPKLGAPTSQVSHISVESSLMSVTPVDFEAAFVSARQRADA